MRRSTSQRRGPMDAMQSLQGRVWGLGGTKGLGLGLSVCLWAKTSPLSEEFTLPEKVCRFPPREITGIQKGKALKRSYPATDLLAPGGWGIG